MRCLRHGLVAIAGLTACAAAVAQAWRLSPEIQTTVTATDNAAYVEGNAARKDLIVDIAPSLQIFGRGPQYTLQGRVALNALYYSRDSAPNRLLPSGRIELNAVPVQRWITLDAVASVDQTAEDPYAVQPDLQSTVNRLTTSRFFVSPALQHDFSDIDSIELRTDQEWIRRSGESQTDLVAGDSHTQNHLFRLARRPVPLGGAIEIAQLDTRYSGRSAYESTTARLVLSFSPDPQMVFSLIGGSERSRFALTESTDPIYGLRAELAPTERTRIDATVEQRFFGTAWDVLAEHRSPQVALSLQAVRRATAQTSSTVLGAGTDTAGLLDAILTTRYPDAAARAVVVRDLIDRLGLPQELGDPVEVFSDTAQRETGLTASVSFLGRLTVVTIAAYTREFTQLQRQDDPLLPPAGYDAANRQRGLTFGINRRLTPLSSVDLLLGYSRIRGLEARGGDETAERDARIALTHQLSARSSATLGARYRETAAVAGTASSDAHETAVFVGLGHRF